MRIERRDSLRLDAAALLPECIARLRAGSDAVILNLSASGILLESPTRLLPGRCCALRLGPASHLTVVEGQVVRCALTRLSPSGQAVYRAAIRFGAGTALPFLP